MHYNMCNNVHLPIIDRVKPPQIDIIGHNRTFLTLPMQLLELLSQCESHFKGVSESKLSTASQRQSVGSVIEVTNEQTYCPCMDVAAVDGYYLT